jgi:hypothetical protein
MKWDDLTDEEKAKFESTLNFFVNKLNVSEDRRGDYYQTCWLTCLEKLHKFDRTKGAIGTFVKWQCRGVISELAKWFIKEGFTFRGTSQWVTLYIFDDSKVRGQGPRGYGEDIEEYCHNLENPHEARRRKLMPAEY